MDRSLTAWRSARARARRMRERWIAAEARCAQLAAEPAVPVEVWRAAQVEAMRANDTVGRVADLLERWHESGPPDERAARSELLRALNGTDERDAALQRLRGRVRELRSGLADMARVAEHEKAVAIEAEARLDRACAVLDRVAAAPTMQLHDGGPRVVDADDLRTRLGLSPR
ncbi:hypothetical protein [Actinacidiphila sp. bgisy160]|uniref:hypothetical protein n=1 Tax=Actinacidiphila sp. bgisy160 TaxID=3413796 RepID=UPI003D7452F0